MEFTFENRPIDIAAWDIIVAAQAKKDLAHAADQIVDEELQDLLNSDDDRELDTWEGARIIYQRTLRRMLTRMEAAI